MDTLADILKFAAENPLLSAVLAAVGPGLYAIWRAAVAAAVRRIEHAFTDQGLQCLPPELQAREVTARVAKASPLLPRGVIESEVRKKQSERPPSA